MIIDDYRFEKLIFTYDEELSKQKNRDKSKLLKLKNFELILDIEEKDVKKIKNFYIFSELNKKNQIQVYRKNSNLSFDDLRWEDSPYLCSYDDELIHLDLQSITIFEHFNKLESLNNKPVINFPLNLYEKLSQLTLFIENENGNIPENKNVELIEPDKFKNLHNNKRLEILEDGVVTFKDVYGLEGIIIKIDDTEYSYSDLKRDKSMGSLTKQYYNLNLIK